MKITLKPSMDITDEGIAEKIAKTIIDKYETYGMMSLYDLKNEVGCLDLCHDDLLVGYAGVPMDVQIHGIRNDRDNTIIFVFEIG